MLPPLIVRQIERALRGLQYGSVQLVIHDAQVVRIERIERIRLTGTPEAQAEALGRPTTTPEVRHVAHKEV